MGLPAHKVDFYPGTGAPDELAAADWNALLNSVQMLRLSVLAYGADPTGASDSTPAILLAEADAAPGERIYFPAGTYRIASAWTQTKAAIYCGAGMGVTILRMAHAGAKMFQATADAAFEDMSIDGADLGTPDRLLAIDSAGSFRASRCRFTGQTFTNYGLGAASIYFVGASNCLVEDCEFIGTPGQGRTSAIGIGKGSHDITIRRSKFRFMVSGIYSNPAPQTPYSPAWNIGEVSDVRIENNYFDGGWWLWPTLISGAAGAVYTDSTVTDNSQTWGANDGQLMRVLPVVVSGVATSFDVRHITVSGATFLSTVAVGQLVRAGGAQGVITRIFDNTTLEVEEWLKVTDLTPLIPANGSAYSVIDTITAHIRWIPPGINGQVVTVNGWTRQRNGERVTTIPAGTPYEVLCDHPVYGAMAALTGCTRYSIIGNNIRRSWADSISYYGTRGTIVGNTVFEGWDVGITLGVYDAGLPDEENYPAFNTVVGNMVERAGSLAISMWSSDNVVVGNTMVDSSWRDQISPSTSALNIEGRAARNLVSGNIVRSSSRRADAGLSPEKALPPGNYAYAILVRDLYSADNIIIGNKLAGGRLGSIYLYIARRTTVMNNVMDGVVLAEFGATLAQEQWNAIPPIRVTYAANWVGAGLSYFLDRNGSVQFLGGALPAVGAGRACGNIPVGFRPTKDIWLTVVRSSTTPFPIPPTPVAVVATIESTNNRLGMGYSAGDIVIHDDVTVGMVAGVHYEFDGCSYRMEAP